MGDYIWYCITLCGDYAGCFIVCVTNMLFVLCSDTIFIYLRGFNLVESYTKNLMLQGTTNVRIGSYS